MGGEVARIEGELESLAKLGWDYQIRAEIGKPAEIIIWRHEWPTGPYTAVPCPTFRGTDLEEVVSQAYESVLSMELSDRE